MKKRIFAILLAALMVCAMFASCTPKDTDAKEINVNFKFTDVNGEVLFDGPVKVVSKAPTLIEVVKTAFESLEEPITLAYDESTGEITKVGTYEIDATHFVGFVKNNEEVKTGTITTAVADKDVIVGTIEAIASTVTAATSTAEATATADNG
ncbi:hypothetical protein SDC9_118044 [bioreactor metagenome]|uniref:Uncharacterized protein n=1 Tax=bioreactor metagenome TaxID=1076179 RepID=A0A645C2A6_9ZZZZ|nr:hypothetical protein [Oscillospiraceae bacterium]